MSPSDQFNDHVKAHLWKLGEHCQTLVEVGDEIFNIQPSWYLAYLALCINRLTAERVLSVNLDIYLAFHELPTTHPGGHKLF